MFFRRIVTLMVLSAAGLVACASHGDDAAGTASVTGGLGGVSFAPKDLHVWTDGDAVEVYFSDLPGSCEFFRAHPYATRAAREHLFDLLVRENGGAPGTYRIAPGGAQSWFLDHDEQCIPRASAQATSGTITIDTKTDAFVTGSFDVAYGPFGSIKGSFTAPVCPPSPPNTPNQSNQCVP